IGHISPEASAGGMIAFIKDGDRINIDINNYSINLLVGEAELTKRKQTMELKHDPNIKGYLKRYKKMVSSADKGATVK
ncbi:MAG: dihydroxy-acid dehydratase, partial [Clostridiales bacterium]|nr:dihydroxy-acid dehydratase [Clostridiales bacterium]